MPRPHFLKLPKLLLAALLVLCLENMARVALSIKQGIELPALPTSLSPLYVAVMSAIWAVIFAICIYGTLRLCAWTPRAIAVAVLLYQANLWVNRLVFSRSSEAVETIVFRALLSISVIGIIFGLLLWPGTRRAFYVKNQASNVNGRS